MRRARALVLLLALLVSTGSVLAQAAHNPAMDCCANGLCPIHRNQKSQSPHEKMPCEGQQNCCCSMNCNNPASQNVVLPVLPEATLNAGFVLPMPQQVRTAVTFGVIFTPSGFVPSPEQPPRQ
jgi:hypothetical protein